MYMVLGKGIGNLFLLVALGRGILSFFLFLFLKEGMQGGGTEASPSVRSVRT